jgi:uncharacterized membrane protein
MLAMTLGGLIEGWGQLYRNHATIETGVAFVHIGGLVGAGGLAISSDRAILRSSREDAAGRQLRLKDLAATHRPVLIGLSLVFASGLLFFLADLDTFLTSWVFWLKMGLVAALMVNGRLLLSAERAVERDPTSEPGWQGLRRRAATSLLLWLVITLAGTALVNVA